MYLKKIYRISGTIVIQILSPDPDQGLRMNATINGAIYRYMLRNILVNENLLP